MNSFLEKYVAPLWWLWMGVFVVMYMATTNFRPLDVCLHPDK